ncbi:hypothetical protein B005_4132 [Nocardiopsis alba ATCC BAA-2165]|uniref:Uncharacterized protein n=1 Tax=Nocardiopsis alba (strain ATCC BAA-2165 / BE74) TaxID=1205910 RepID=J7LE04_NOCAA|nr:hypothetical protein B005_4132 [Nocardiopsis alba ATCC BAA-2165]
MREDYPHVPVRNAPISGVVPGDDQRRWSGNTRILPVTWAPA